VIAALNFPIQYVAAQGSPTIVSISTPTASVTPNTPIYKGCFKSSAPLEDHGSYNFQSRGNCLGICVLLQKTVFGVTSGSNCFCGDLLPANDTYVDDSQCDTPCNGFDKETCGGPDTWTVFLTAINKNRVNYYDPVSASSSQGASATKGQETVTESVVIAPSATSSPEASPNDSKPNVAGIAAGVVVGVVGLAGLIFGIWFFLRQRRRRQLEEEHKRQAAVNQFFAAGKTHHSQSSMGDSRLDPEIMHRRQSDGSIADNQDYSRRILTVTNPDGY